MQESRFQYLQSSTRTILKVTVISIVLLTLCGQLISYIVTIRNEDKKPEEGSIVQNMTEHKNIHATIGDLPLQIERVQTPAVLKNSTLPNVHEKTDKCIKRLPQAIIVGIQKSGTTALLKFLNSHPQIVGCLDPVEPQYFSGHYKSKTLDWYRHLMPCSFSNQITIEKSPPYFYRGFCAERIRAMNPHTKIIIIAKDPIERAISMYAMLKESSQNMKRFEDLVTINNHTTINEQSVFINWSNYPKYMKAWLDNFELKQILVVNGNNVERDPAKELNRVEDFLGIDTYFTADKFIFNKTKGKYCLAKSKTKSKCLGKKKGRPHPEVQENVRSILVKYFSSLNEQFFKMTNTTFNWGY